MTINDRLLITVRDEAERGHFSFANVTLPLKREGLIETRHEGWGVYSVTFTKKGFERLAALQDASASPSSYSTGGRF